MKIKYEIILLSSVIVILIMSVLGTLSIFNTFGQKEALNLLFELSSIIISLFAILIALLIPFIMKDIEKKRKQENRREKEKEIIFEIIKRVKEYLNYYSKKNLKNQKIYLNSLSPFLLNMQEKYPEIFMKIGIEIVKRKSPSYIEFTTLVVIDKYIFNIYPNKIDIFLGHMNNPLKQKREEKCQEILHEMRVYANEKNNLSLDESWFDFP